MASGDLRKGWVTGEDINREYRESPSGDEG